MERVTDTFKEAVFRAVALIPRGRVASYGQVAQMAGYSEGAARAVGNALHTNTDSGKTPCHRVVTSSGQMGSNYGFGGPELQRSILKAEGVRFIGDRVDMAQSGIAIEDHPLLPFLPPMETFVKIAELLDVDINELLPRLESLLELSVIKKKKPVFVSILREEMVSNYPYQAIRELLLNACMHRDMQSNTPLRFYEFASHRYKDDENDTHTTTHTSTRTSSIDIQPYSENVTRLVLAIGKEEMSVKSMMEAVGLKNRPNFMDYSLAPAIREGFVCMKYPANPHHPRQRYLLTLKGLMLLDGNKP